jgi:small-conductance mechanosensitive channel
MTHRATIALLACAGLALGACGEQSADEAAPAQPQTQQTTPPANTSAPSNSLNANASPTTAGDAQQAADAAEDAVEDAAAQAEEAAAQITDQMRAAMTGYLEQMSAAIGSLEGIETRMSAMTKSPELKSIIDQMQGFRDELGALPDETLSALKAEFSAQLDGLTARLQQEIDRISSNPDLAGSLGELLKQIPSLG